MNKKGKLLLFFLLFLFLTGGVYVVNAWVPSSVVGDPLVRMPGTQPNQVTLEAPTRCMNCHAGYNSSVEPGFNWQGSMMAQAARDFLFWSCMTVAAQDSIWALGNPNATDICERCHFPQGWLEGRSDPTNASLMTGPDYDGVQCDFCHQMYDPFFETTHSGSRESGDWLVYWDETNNSGTPSRPAADATYLEDKTLAGSIVQLDGANFFTNNLPPAGYTENGSGQYFVSPGGQKRASFADATARHQMFYSRYHKSKYFCNACHDVSNPILANLGLSGLPDLGTGLITEQYSAAQYFHVERTFSEFMLSAYGQQGGAATNLEFQAQGAADITHAAKCQDCHMRDVTGQGANKRDAIVRPDQSIEHPNSGVPLHDMTGGNVWVSTVLASTVLGSPNYDPVNEGLLNQGPAVLTLDLTQGLGLNPQALLAGADRARQQLLLAATIQDVIYNDATGALSFKVQNNSGHKLISGFPEGRRMFVNIKAYAGGNLVYEVNPYDYTAGTLKGLPQSTGSPALGPSEVYADELVYETHPGSTLTGEQETFHFALATGRYKDNRIPPKGFDITGADERLSVPVWHGVEDPDYFAAAEYAGGYDAVAISIAAGADTVEVNLYYQTTSREYIEFLRDEINGDGSQTLSSPTPSGESQAYVIQTDPFFSRLKAWGDTLWQLWTHNMNVDGAKPFLMAQATFGGTTGCSVLPPELLTATAGNGLVDLTWSSVGGSTAYKLYYDQAGKAQLVANTGLATAYTNTGLTNGDKYCYKVTASDATCESGYSNILCATPQNQGQTGSAAGVSQVVTGVYTGKGPNKSFQPKSIFAAGELVTIRALVLDGTGQPVSNATVAIVIGGPETTSLNSNPSGADGWAEATWQTRSPNRKGQGGTTPGAYTATTTNVTASGYTWDGVTTGTNFTIQ